MTPNPINTVKTILNTKHIKNTKNICNNPTFSKHENEPFQNVQTISLLYIKPS